ncbi:C-C motif chemokine 13-like [Astyanax mexicanus]|uniref:C-C motif chemokine 13-like n=1 Tax=Astyanax mexicanus TaxID=7994 RepID=A0A8T2LQ80_ASTMX|nr:C-C motif chemokine 13-like [Astyanax mexicanus]
MRSGSALLLVLLLGSLQLSSSAPAVNQPDCCFKLTTMRIPQKMVKSYTQTSSDCALKAIVITTVKGRKFCVDPAAKWVSGHVKSLKKHTQ